MAILSNEKYLIYCTFYDNDDRKPNELPVYIGTIEELRRTIATTWFQIPHRVVISSNAVNVMSNLEESKVLANFVFTDILRKHLPDHF